MTYFVLSRELNLANCAIYENPGELPNRHYAARGIRMGDSFPNGYKFKMSDDVPAFNIPDVINNALGYFMISARMKELLEQHATGEIEFLRFTLLNHKGRVASDDCFIANLIGTVDCVDSERTVGWKSKLKPGQYDKIKNLFLADDKIDPKVNLFRIASLPRVVVVRDDLKAVLEGQQVTGVKYYEMGSKLEIN